jgi:hypothetical protein
MKSSRPLNVKVAVLPRKDDFVQRLRNFVLVAFAIVATVFLVEMQIAANLGLAF